MKPDRVPHLLDPRADTPAVVRDALAAGRAELPSAAALARLAAKLPPPGGGAGGSGAEWRPASNGSGAGSTGAGGAGSAPVAASSLLPGVAAGTALGAVFAAAMALWTPGPVSAPGTAVNAADPSPVAEVAAPAERPVSAGGPEQGREPSDSNTTSIPKEQAPSPSGGTDVGHAAEPADTAAAGNSAAPPASTVAASPARSALTAPGARPLASTSSGGTGGGAFVAPGLGPNKESESALLQRAQQALAGNPRAALALADEHLARYAGGMLAQEREVIAINALAAMGRAAQAKARAAAFLSAYPRSAHRPRVEALVHPAGQ